MMRTRVGDLEPVTLEQLQAVIDNSDKLHQPVGFWKDKLHVPTDFEAMGEHEINEMFGISDSVAGQGSNKTSQTDDV